MTSKIRLSEKVLPVFHKSWKEYDNPKYLNIYEKGGRGSSKSTTITEKLIMNRMKTDTHAVVCRKYARTLRMSVRNQLIWSLFHLGVEQYWKYSKSATGDPTLVYKPTGTKIYFEGADGDKIKGWKTPDMPTVDIFFEEITDFKTDEELSSIKLSIMRQKLPKGHKYTFFHAYNPPKRKGHWVNKLCESQVLPNNVYVHHSDYRTNPFLPDEFFVEAEHIKSTN
jgi:PBSX family phage terminase large subunit